ncbi:MAG TPA: ribonuclease III [Coxiellaceae bacterium]|nr:ribonuclease III [Coxiellaceae bacterium]
MPLKPLMNKMGYPFKDLRLLECALSHRSLETQSNERLEFLGDAILNFVIAEYLFTRFPNLMEGELSRMRASVVNGDSLATVAKALSLPDYMRLGVGELRNGHPLRDSILADAMEAIMGAVYLDGGSEKVQECILKWLKPLLDNLSALKPPKDAKSELQEWTQANHLALPDYEVTCITGKAHDQNFHVICRIEGLDYRTEAEGRTRRKAEQLAALQYLALLKGKRTS